MSNGQKIRRKLRAILSADVKGYSLLMADDEIFTIQTLKSYRQIMTDIIRQGSGHVVDNPGDNMLAEFSSAVDAVQCAVRIQRKLKKENARFVEEKRLRFRIGINIGDVVQAGDSIFGSGVNIASRIEGLSDAGGICISKNTYEQVKNKLDLGFDYLGEHELKNIEEPVGVYRVLMDFDSAEPLVKTKLELPDKPSIAVLPFNNMSGDPSQEYFSDGLTEQIISGLSKVRNLFVIARNSSFAYKDRSISVKQVAQELGVKYILEGSVQKAGERVRITAQLIDATTDYHMWSESYDRVLSDIFAFQDEITMNLISSMEVNLTSGEQARLWRGKGTTSIKAYDMFQRGLEYFYRFNEKDNKLAQKFLYEAISIDNSFSIAYAYLGLAFTDVLFYGWSDSPIESFEQVEKYTEKALALDESLDLAHILLSQIHLFKRQYDESLKEGERAVELNPNGAVAHLNLGYALCCSGKTEAGIKLLERAFRLNPIPLPHYYTILALAYRNNEQYDKAIEYAGMGLVESPDDLVAYLILASSFIFLDRIEEAQNAAEQILRISPNFSVTNWGMTMPYKDQNTIDWLLETFRKAGLPD
jgi:adenylate cyclase